MKVVLRLGSDCNFGTVVSVTLLPPTVPSHHSEPKCCFASCLTRN